MTPQTFISRMIDVFEWRVGSETVKPKTFYQAANYIYLNGEHLCTEENGYHWSVTTGETLDYVVIKASLSDGVSDIVASLCFNIECPDQLIANWHRGKIDSPESQMNMLAMLTLKTNNRVTA